MASSLSAFCATAAAGHIFLLNKFLVLTEVVSVGDDQFPRATTTDTQLTLNKCHVL